MRKQNSFAEGCLIIAEYCRQAHAGKLLHEFMSAASEGEGHQGGVGFENPRPSPGGVVSSFFLMGLREPTEAGETVLVSAASGAGAIWGRSS